MSYRDFCKVIALFSFFTFSAKAQEVNPPINKSLFHEFKKPRFVSQKDTTVSLQTRQQIVNLRNQSNAYRALNNKTGIRKTFKEAISLASGTGNEFLLNDTRLAYATNLSSVHESKEAISVLKTLLPKTSFTETERIHIVCLLIINSLKLNIKENIETYHLQLKDIDISRFPINISEYLMASAMYHAEKKNFITAGKYYRALLKQLHKDSLNRDLILEGGIQLASLYSRRLNKDSSDYYFKVVAKQLRGLDHSHPLYIAYLKAHSQHVNQYKSKDQLIKNLNKELLTKDSLYRLELIDATKDLGYNYRILQGEQNLKILSQQRQLDALTFSKERQQGLFIILGLVAVLMAIAGLCYLYYYRKQQSLLLHQKEVEKLNLIHKTEVIKVLAESQEAERRRIADQLHDEVGSMLTVARLNLSSLDTDINNTAISPEQLKTANKILGTVAGTIREMSHQLMPVAIKQYGLKYALEQLIIDINISKKIFVEHVIMGLDDPSIFPENFQVSLYRIIQELFQNVLKHAGATNAIFQIIVHKESLNILMEDNGKGFQGSSDNHKGKGMELIATRIAYFEGTLKIEGNSGNGTLILIDIPIQTITT